MRDGAALPSCAMALRCLLVDDNARFLEAARALLEREGLVVDVASTGAEALRRARRFQPDVVLIDIDIDSDSESGFELARRCDERRVDDTGNTTSSPTRNLRILLVSTHQKEDFEEFIVEGPALGFLAKSSLSARAIRELLDGEGGGMPDGEA